MRCPRCGWDNPLDITACQRCGLGVHETPTSSGQQGPGGYQPAPGQPYPPGQPQVQSQGAPPAPPSPNDPYRQGPAPYGQGGYPVQSSPSPSNAGQPQSPYAPYAGYPGGQQPAPYQQQYGAFSPQPAAAERRTPPKSGRLVRLLLLLGAVASIAYAVWAFTARRVIFVDFVDNRPVSLSRAQTSDRIDTTFLIIAGALALIALGGWLLRLLSGRSHGGAMTTIGFVVSALGIACIVVGLVLSGLVGNGDSQIAQGHRAVTATVVTGCGFLALAVGLLIGLVVLNRRGSGEKAASTTTPPPTPAASSPW